MATLGSPEGSKTFSVMGLNQTYSIRYETPSVEQVPNLIRSRFIVHGLGNGVLREAGRLKKMYRVADK